MKLTRAAIRVSPGMKVLQAAPAAYPCRSAAWRRSFRRCPNYLAKKETNPMGNDDIAKPGKRSPSVPTLVLLALAIGLGVGFAAGWVSRGGANTLPELGVQEGSVS